MTKRQNKNTRPAKAAEVDIQLTVQVYPAPNEDVRSSVIRQLTVSQDTHMVMRTIEAAQTLGLQMLVENRFEESGQVVFDVSIYADEIWVDEEDVNEEWPSPVHWTPAGRDITDDQQDLFGDPRWDLYAARAVWVWLHVGACLRGAQCGDDDWELMWIADFSTVALRPE